MKAQSTFTQRDKLLFANSNLTKMGKSLYPIGLTITTKELV